MGSAYYHISAQWVARITHNRYVVRSNPIKGSRCLPEQETLPVLLSAGWFQERISSVIYSCCITNELIKINIKLVYVVLFCVGNIQREDFFYI